MNTGAVSVALPIALAVIMFGLGLSLTIDDFARVARHPKVVAIALICQVLVLPALAFGLILAFDLPPLLAVGMMLLAASPGGASANLFSHLFRGDVALNVSLTAVNSVISVVTIPVLVNFAIDYFEPVDDTGAIGLQLGKVVQVFAVVLVPVVLGMILRRAAPGFAERMDKPVRIASVVLLALVVVVGVSAERSDAAGYLRQVGAITALFCLLSLTTGYFVPRRLGIGRRQAIACSMEIGIHNSAISITIAISVLDSTQIAVPAAVYAILMTPMAAAVGWLLTRSRHPRHDTADLQRADS